MWGKVVSRNYYVLSNCAQQVGLKNGLKLGKIYWRHKNLLTLSNNVPEKRPLTDVFFDNETVESNFEEFIQSINPDCEEAVQIGLRDIEKDLKLMPGKSREDCRFLFDRLAYELALMCFGIYCSLILEKKLSSELGEDKFDKIKGDVMHPFKNTIIAEEYSELENLRESKDANSSEIAESLANRFGFIHSEYRGRSWTKEDYLREMSVKKQGSRSSHLDLDSLGLTDYQLWLCKMSQYWMYIYDDGKAALVRAIWALRETVTALGHDEHLIMHQTYPEFLEWVKSGEDPDSSILIRDAYYATLLRNDEFSYYSGKDEVATLVKEEKLTEYDEVPEVSELKGLCAYPGNTQGKVRRVFSYKDAEALEEGEVLVASMTTPELIAAMRKAAAFVTDEGGITSHAAIVAREMGKPCVVGTKIATKVLKDGDLVVVDNGTVSIK